MGVASLVLGIVGLIFSLFFGPLAWLGTVMGIVGVILGALGRKEPEQRGMATAGLVLSIISLSLGVIFTIACAACIAAGTGALSNF